MLRDSEGRTLPEGTRVVTVPFRHRGVVFSPSSTGCTIILDEPMAHTDRIHSCWSEVWEEGLYDVTELEDDLRRDKLRAKATADQLEWAELEHERALIEVALVEIELGVTRLAYGR